MSSTKQTKDEKNFDAVLAKIGDMPDPVRTIGERVHQIILESVPDLKPRVWYGSAGYAKSASTPVLIFFRFDEMFTLGLTEKANVKPDSESDGNLMPSAWFFESLDSTTEKRIAAIAKQAAG